MNEHGQVLPEGEHNTSQFQLAKRFVRQRVVPYMGYFFGFLWIVAVVIAVMAHNHLLFPENWHIFPHEQLPALGIVTALVLILQEQTKEAHEEISKGLRGTRSAALALETRLQALECQFHQPYYLDELVRRIPADLARVDAGQEIVIHHLGLDMGHAWDLVKDHILPLARQGKTIRYRLMMMAGEPDSFRNVPTTLRKDLTEWSQKAGSRLKDIIKAMEEQGLAERFKAEIYTYTDIPVIHGYWINLPVPAWYISICRWSGPRYEEYSWGRGSYHHIVGVPNSAELNDLAAVFESYFQHLLAHSTKAFPTSPGDHAREEHQGGSMQKPTPAP